MRSSLDRLGCFAPFFVDGRWHDISAAVNANVLRRSRDDVARLHCVVHDVGIQQELSHVGKSSTELTLDSFRLSGESLNVSFSDRQYDSAVKRIRDSGIQFRLSPHGVYYRRSLIASIGCWGLSYTGILKRIIHELLHAAECDYFDKFKRSEKLWLRLFLEQYLLEHGWENAIEYFQRYLFNSKLFKSDFVKGASDAAENMTELLVDCAAIGAVNTFIQGSRVLSFPLELIPDFPSPITGKSILDCERSYVKLHVLRHIFITEVLVTDEEREKFRKLEQALNQADYFSTGCDPDEDQTDFFSRVLVGLIEDFGEDLFLLYAYLLTF